MPFTIPLEMPTVATDGLLLLHVPPAIALLRVMLDPMHTCDGPVMDAGDTVTETMWVV